MKTRSHLLPKIQVTYPTRWLRFDQFARNELAMREAQSEGPSAWMHEPIPLGTPYPKK